MERENSASGVAWTALVLAVVALILSWTAFNRSGEDVLSTVTDEVEEAADSSEQELDEEFVDENEVSDEVETDASVNVVN